MLFKKKNRPRKSKNTIDQPRAVYSFYNNQRPDEVRKEQRIRQNIDRTTKQSRWGHHGLTILSVITIFICLGYALSLNSNPVVVPPYKQSSIFLQDAATYQAAAHTILDKSVLNNNKITINTTSVTKELKDKFPELSDVSVTLPIISRRPLVYIVPSQPTLILNAKNGQFILNEKGTAVLAVSRAKDINKLKLPMVEDKTNTNVVIGKTALPASQVIFIDEVNEQLKQAKQTIKSISLPTVANQLDVQLEGQNFYTKMDMHGSSRVQAGSLLAVLKHLSETKQTPASYIDVRIEGRAYYK